MTRQYFSDQKNLHSHTDDLNVVDHPKSGEKEKKNRLVDEYKEKLLEKTSNVLSNRKLLTYAGSVLAIGLIIGTASAITYRLRKKKSPTYFLTKWLNGKF